MQDLGTLGGRWSGALAINESGQVAGWSDITGSTGSHAFLYRDGVMQDMGTLGGTRSMAYGINANGQVVGRSYLAGSTTWHAFLYSGGAMLDLNDLVAADSGWRLSEARAINDLGQIIGTGTNPAGQRHAFLLTPVPEPATLSLLAIGGLAVKWRPKRRMR